MRATVNITVDDGGLLEKAIALQRANRQSLNDREELKIIEQKAEAEWQRLWVERFGAVPENDKQNRPAATLMPPSSVAVGWQEYDDAEDPFIVIYSRDGQESVRFRSAANSLDVPEASLPDTLITLVDERPEPPDIPGAGDVPIGPLSNLQATVLSPGLYSVVGTNEAKALILETAVTDSDRDGYLATQAFLNWRCVVESTMYLSTSAYDYQYAELILPIDQNRFVYVYAAKEKEHAWTANVVSTRTATIRLSTEEEYGFGQVYTRVDAYVGTASGVTEHSQSFEVFFAAVVGRESVRQIPFPSTLRTILETNSIAVPSAVTAAYIPGGTWPTNDWSVSDGLLGGEFTSEPDNRSPDSYWSRFGILSTSRDPEYDEQVVADLDVESPIYGTAAVYKILQNIGSDATLPSSTTDFEILREYFRSEAQSVKYIALCPDTTESCSIDNLQMDRTTIPPGETAFTTFVREAIGRIDIPDGFNASSKAPLIAWDWGNSSYCRRQLLDLGFTTDDFTP